ncbi:MAG: hypothetical protein ACD_5C00008G0005 [uncultured bacterium]|nr:MAG: hypothetical protein ACD_5C00008G0005 [uncultured bacterium]
MRMFDEEYKFHKYIEGVKQDDELKSKKKIHVNRANEMKFRGWSTESLDESKFKISVNFCVV